MRTKALARQCGGGHDRPSHAPPHAFARGHTLASVHQCTCGLTAKTVPTPASQRTDGMIPPRAQPWRGARARWRMPGRRRQEPRPVHVPVAAPRVVRLWDAFALCPRVGPVLVHVTGAALGVVPVVSRSISPPWGSIRFRLALRMYAPWGVRVVSQTKSRKIPTRNILSLFFETRTLRRACTARGTCPCSGWCLRSAPARAAMRSRHAPAASRRGAAATWEQP